MKNLIEEIENKIEELKNELDDLEYYRETCIEIETYKYILSILNQYNIITAPKSIKLSEVVSKLTKDFPAHNFYYRYDTKWIAIWLGNHCYATFAIKDNKLVLENKDEFEYPKWLYTLWIADTIIEDDLKESDE